MTEHRQNEFENQIIEKGNAILDEIFGGDEVQRERVAIEGPGGWRAGEISMSARYEKPEEFAKLIDAIIKWLEEGNNWEKLEDIMLI